MKRKTNYKSEVISRVTFYLDDIEEILELLKNNCEKISAGGKGYELEQPTKIDEYKNLSKEQFDTLNIECQEPYVTVSISQSALFGGVNVHIGKDDPTSLGLLTAILDIAKKRQNKFVLFYKSFNTFLLITAILSGFLLLLHSKYKLDLRVLMAILWGWLMVRWLTSDWGWSRSQVNFRKEYSHQRTGFLTRNRDKIILILIGAVVGAILQFGSSFVIDILKNAK